MKLAVLKEIAPGENRVAIIPDALKRLQKKGIKVLIQTGAGIAAGYLDEEYEKAGATLIDDPTKLIADSDAVVKVQPPSLEEIGMLKPNSVYISILQAFTRHDLVQGLAKQQITAFGLETIPRTTLAQSMDVLSSMSTIAGYKSVILAANHLIKFFPMLMTAAGTVAPARVLVLGAGVAGLMACATANVLAPLSRRLM